MTRASILADADPANPAAASALLLSSTDDDEDEDEEEEEEFISTPPAAALLFHFPPFLHPIVLPQWQPVVVIL
jgi:hypothetical protein